MAEKVKIGAYYFPGWGREHNEWDIVKSARPYFSGHFQPRVPLNGYYDDNKPETIRRQTEIASSHGIDAFIFDWYWKHGKMELRKPLDLFLHNSGKMNFAIMWSWKTSKKDLPVSPEHTPISEKERWVETNKEDFVNLLNFCNKNYFSRENYWRVGNRPYFVLYLVEGFLSILGREKFGEMISEGKELFRKKGIAEPYLVGVVTSPLNVKGLGLDSLTGYNFLPCFKEKGTDKDEILQDYGTLIDERIKDWHRIKKISGLPYSPSISVGWDATPRGTRVSNLSGLGFPWSPIVVNGSPHKFGEFLMEGIKFAEGEETKKVHICAWNEWSEGAYLEPDKLHGYKYLQEVLKAKRLVNL